MCGKDRRKMKNGSWRLYQSRGEMPKKRERMEGERKESDIGCSEREKTKKKMGKKKNLELVPDRPFGAKWRKWGKKRNGERKIGRPL